MTVDAPLEIDRTESSRINADHVRLRLSGRWLDRSGVAEEELLVVQVEGRRHRFPAARDPARDDPERWSATFTLPVWAEPRLDGQAALWIGNSVIAVSPPGSDPGPSSIAEPAPAREPAVAEPSGAPEPLADPELVPDVADRAADAALSADIPPPYSAPVEASRSGPLADLLLKETVAALHAELDHRTVDAARMRGELADAQSELEARNAVQAALEVTLGELRVELERLTTAVERRRAEFEARMAEAEREKTDNGRLVAELKADNDRQVAELQAALDQRTAEAARVREQLAGMQGAADRRASDAGRLREELATVSVARDAAESEVAGLRAELSRLGTELAATRERVGADGGDLGSAHRLLADARALADQLRAGEVQE